MFSDRAVPWLTETAESKSTDKEGLLDFVLSNKIQSLRIRQLWGAWSKGLNQGELQSPPPGCSALPQA